MAACATHGAIVNLVCPRCDGFVVAPGMGCHLMQYATFWRLDAKSQAHAKAVRCPRPCPNNSRSPNPGGCRHS